MTTRLVVEWTRSTVRVASASIGGRGPRVLTTHTALLTGSGDLTEKLRELVRAAGAVNEVVAVVPREQVITRVVKFPTQQPAELAQMVELYARAQLPYSREQTVMDFYALGQSEGFSIVAIVACQQDVIHQVLRVLREVGLSPNLLTVSSWGVLEWYRLARPKPLAESEPVLVVNLDESRTDLVLIAHGRVLSSRSVGQGLAEWTAIGDPAELLVSEVERSRAAIRKELSGTDVRGVLLTGLGETLTWRDAVGQRLGLPVEVLDARSAFKDWKSPSPQPISPVVCGGLAFGELDGLLSLNPPEIRAAVQHRRQVRDLATVSVLVAAVLGLGVGLLALEMGRHQRLGAALDRVVAKVAPMARQVKDRSRTNRLVQSVLANRRHLATTLADIFRSTPSGVGLEVVAFEQARRELTIRGNAGSTHMVLSYIGQLEQLEGIEGVRLKYSRRRSGDAGEQTSFELILAHREPG